ncbi:RHS repeat-associated core domain-containing protein [Streptomyces sp. NPDC057302]|uniref:RHS repeat-associated core domain-containing protein n=1 Tax=Streptomyces sp. NPDC057302 TaxID=3346094 RepID=UPI0036424947
MARDGKAYYYLTDALGSVVAVADESGARSLLLLQPPRRHPGAGSEKVSHPYRFVGYQDPTGLYHFAARYYDPNIGRFNSPDPPGQQKNPYPYAEGDPVNRIDTNGLASFGISGEVCAFGACVGGGVAVNDDGASVSAEGDTTAGLSIQYSSPGCSAKAQYTF